MKVMTKVLVGTGVTAAIGSGIAIAVSLKMIEKAKNFVKKQELKKFVSEDMANNKTFVSLIDQLDAQEIMELTDLIEKAKERQKLIHMSAAEESLTEEVKKKLVRFLDILPTKTVGK